MGVSEVKRWIAVMVLAGMLISLGGSYALTKSGTERNREDIVILRVDLGKSCETFQEELKIVRATAGISEVGVERRLSRIEAQIEGLKEGLDRLFVVIERL